MNEISLISQTTNYTYRHCSRLLDLGLTPIEIELTSLDNMYASRTPRRKYRLIELYKSVYRNQLIKKRHDKQGRVNIKKNFYQKWVELRLPFNESMIDTAWEDISKQVLIHDMEDNQ